MRVVVVEVRGCVAVCVSRSVFPRSLAHSSGQQCLKSLPALCLSPPQSTRRKHVFTTCCTVVYSYASTLCLTKSSVAVCGGQACQECITQRAGDDQPFGPLDSRLRGHVFATTTMLQRTSIQYPHNAATKGVLRMLVGWYTIGTRAQC